jgi:alpha-L-fucosidase 2
MKLFALNLFFTGILLISLTGCRNTNSDETCKSRYLWYTHPAKDHHETLPLGNGKLGVQLYGSPVNEHIQLNDDSMWPGDSDLEMPQGNPDDLKKIREYLIAGDNRKADSLFVAKFSNKTVVRSHQTLGDLFIDLDSGEISEYYRRLAIDSAIATVSYKKGGNPVTERVFVSNPHHAIVIEFRSNKTGGLNGKIRLSRPKDEGFPTAEVFTRNGLLYMKGEVTQRKGRFNSEPFPFLYGVKFETIVKVKNDDGKIVQGTDYLTLENVTHMVLYVVSNTSFYYKDYENQNIKELKIIEDAGFDNILKSHVDDYRHLFTSVSLKLTDENLDTIPTDRRIDRVKSGKTDLGLEALLFQYGRYLLISSSREGTNPANLQGLWNDFMKAPWNADYHLNINLQMNYWPATVTGLGSLNEPFFRFTNRLLENGKAVARNNFGCRGSFAPHATDIWAPAWLRAPTAYWGCSVGAGGWLAHHYRDYYLFTGDTLFLKKQAYPVIKNVTQFYSDWLTVDPRDGKLVSAPSTSPENRFINKKGDTVATCMGSAVDQQVINEVFNNYLKTCDILKINNPLYDTVKKQLKRLRQGLVIGSDGRILEWDREYKEIEPGHRHMSHMYSFYPGDCISADSTPALFNAVKKSIDYRLEHGGAGPGWSRAWLINCDARLMQGDRAQKDITTFIQRSLYPNLFDAHPPFQIDGNFGYTAGIAEMLLQSFEKGVIRLLPALPSSWKNGYIKGLKARTGLTVDIYWKNNKLTKAVIYSKFNTGIKLVYGQKVMPVKLKAGERYVFKN